MKKRIILAVISFCLLLAFCVTAAASEAIPTAAENTFRLSGVSLSNMETDALTLGVGDKVTLRIYAQSATLTDCTFLLQYNKDAFTYATTTADNYDNNIITAANSNGNGTVTFTCDLSDTASFSGPILIATVYFNTAADVSQTAYSFSLTDGTNAVCSPVTATITHRHAFGAWTTISVSQDGTVQTQKRTCIQCDASETRETPVVDYSISLKSTAKRISYNEAERLLYKIAPDTTVGTLVDSLQTEGDLQVIDKNGMGLSRNDKLATGMTVLVMDEGEIEANVQFSAAVSVWGDADGDGIVGAGDARIALRKSVNLENALTKAQIAAVDSNADGKVDAGDARFILRVSVALDAFYAIPATSINLSKTQMSLYVGQSGSITATLLPSDTTIKTVTWTSSNTNVATVQNGTVTAKGAGTAVITATANSGVSKTCTVTVTQPVESVTYKRSNFYLPENDSVDLTAAYTVNPENATVAGCTWTTSDSAFTAVNGVVRCTKAYSAVSNKTVTVTCTFPGGKTASFKLTLIPANASYCCFSYETLQVSLNQKFKLSTTALSSGAVLNMVSSNSSVLSIDNSTQVITAKGIGSATITCTGVNYTETVTVNVKSNALQVNAFDVNKAGKDLSLTVKNTSGKAISNFDFYVAALNSKGEQLNLSIARIDSVLENNTSKTVSWTTFWSNPAVTSAKITQVIITYADGHMETVSADNIYYGA